MKKWFEMAVWKQVLIGMILGIVVGITFREDASYVRPIGDIFIRLVQMMITPLIFLSLVGGLTSITDKKSLSRLASKAIFAFLITTSLAITIGIVAATLFQPGADIPASAIHSGAFTLPSNVDKSINLTKLISDVVPNNALNALVSGQILQVVFFSIFTGIILNMMGKESEPIVHAIQICTKLVFKMISVVMHAAPYGAFALTATVVGKQGFGLFSNLITLLIAFFSAMTLQYLVFGLLIAVFGRISPFPFYKKSLEYQAIAFSTSSSKVTLPVTMEVCSTKMGISKNNSSFILPLGAAINMDGMAIYLGICTIFVTQIYGLELQFIDYVTIILLSTVGSIGAAGIPGGTLIMLPMLLTAFNLPIDAIALLVGIDRILDMVRTVINITGDATITLIVDSTEGTLDKKLYYTPSEKIPDSELLK